MAYTAYQAWTIVLGSFWYYFQMGQSGVSQPNAFTGQTATINNHGTLIYVEPWQATLHIVSLIGGTVIFAAIVLWAQIRLGRASLAGFHRVAFALALAGAVLFWWLAPEAARRLGG